MKFTEEQIDRWRIHLEEQAKDTAWVQSHAELDRRREAVVLEMQSFLRSFLTREVSVPEFRETFDKRTRNDWSVFGFKGMSGAMFLNKLVKHIPDTEELFTSLAAAMTVPHDEASARHKMTGFVEFLEGLIKSGHSTVQLLQPARVPFFVSGWWHLQDVETWPIYYATARDAFRNENLYVPPKHPVEAYFLFRDAFQSLAAALGLGSWDLEHVCAWLICKGGETREDPPESPIDDEETDPLDEIPAGADAEEGPNHAHTQWILATIGRKLGCRIWIAKNDHAKVWDGKALGALSIPELPNLGMGQSSQKLISLIDVLWLKGTNQVVAAFEVEHSTSVYSGLLRMADLTALAPNLFFPLYIVAPDLRRKKVRRELSRPSMQTLELHKRCSYISSEKLAEQSESIMQWASSPSAIDNIAEHVGDAREVDGE